MILYEYHVDDHYAFQDECKNLQFSGNLSVRKSPEEKMVMMIGQDEAIMQKIYLHCWHGHFLTVQELECPKMRAMG